MIYDAVVIGVGGMGSAALYHLAKKGMRVLGIEQFDVPHTLGSSHGHTRVIRKAYFEHPSYVPLLEKAYDMWDVLEQDAGRKVSNYCGMIYAGKQDSASIQGVKKSSELYGVPIEPLSQLDLKERYPQFAFDDGMVGLYEPCGGYLLVEECVKAHCEAAQKHGAELKTNTNVKTWRHVNGVHHVQTDQGEFQAKSLVVSAGAWAEPLLHELNLPLTIQRIPSGWFEPLNDHHTLENGFPIFGIETQTGFFYGFPVLDERGVKIARYEGSETVDSIEAVDRTVHDGDLDHIHQFIAQYMPGVTKQVNDSSICIYTVTPDNHFIIDQHPHHKNLYIAAGFSGHGFKFCPAVGVVLAGLACDGKTDVDIDFLGLGRFASSKND